MAAIQERNSDHQLTEPWFDFIRHHAERMVQESRLPVTAHNLFNVVGLSDVSNRTNHHSERIANVMTALGFIQERKTINGDRHRGWWPSGQPAQPND
jgi:hypothetical protein